MVMITAMENPFVKIVTDDVTPRYKLLRTITRTGKLAEIIICEMEFERIRFTYVTTVVVVIKDEPHSHTPFLSFSLTHTHTRASAHIYSVHVFHSKSRRFRMYVTSKIVILNICIFETYANNS